MKIEFTEGCTNDGRVYVGDKEFSSLPLERQKEIAQKLIEKCESESVLEQVVREVVREVGEYEDLGQCGQCFDWVSSWSIEEEGE